MTEDDIPQVRDKAREICKLMDELPTEIVMASIMTAFVCVICETHTDREAALAQFAVQVQAGAHSLLTGHAKTREMMGEVVH